MVSTKQPWFDYYDDQAEALGGSTILAELQSIIQKAKEKVTTRCRKTKRLHRAR